MIIYWCWCNPAVAFVPYNNLVSYYSEPIDYYTEKQKKEIFPLSTQLEENWENIRAEGWRLIENRKSDNVLRHYHQLVGSDDNIWKGWNIIPLRWFGNNSINNLEDCPTLKNILKNENKTISILYSLLIPGKYVPPHVGPFKGMLRYHLGLDIPDKSLGVCQITVNGKEYAWRNGEGVLFDETYLHSVINATCRPRLILMVDVERPFNNKIMETINSIIISIISMIPATQKAIL